MILIESQNIETMRPIEIIDFAVCEDVTFKGGQVCL